MPPIFVIVLSCFLGAVYVKAQGNYIRVCYYTNWAQYRPKAMKFFPEDVDYNLCSHLVYAFAKLEGNRLAAFEWNDESTEWMRGMYDRFNDIKGKNPSIKTLVAVGGWNMGSKPFTKMVATPASRREFATSTVKFLRDRNFDGVDMDWEYPANRGSPPEDRHKFTQLLSEIRRTFDDESRRTGKEPLLLTAAVAAGKSKIDTGYDVPQFCRDMDFVSLMAYDLHGSWENVTGHNSPLYAHNGETGEQRYLNMDWASNYWVQMGCPRNKLIIGMGLYGRSFTLKDYHRNGLMAPVRGKGDAGKYTREGGFLAYYEICEMQRNGAQTYYIKEQEVPYVVMGSQWVGYDDTDSLRIKVRWMKQNGFGGIMVWAVDLDDFKNTCGFGKYPLLTAINQELGVTTGTVIQPAQPRIHGMKPPAQAMRPMQIQQQQQIQQQVPTTTTASPPYNMPHVTKEFQCPPNAKSYYASPSSCSEYFMCVGDTPIKFTCASPLLWDDRNNFCEWPDKIQCNKNKPIQMMTHQIPVPKPRPPPAVVHVLTTKRLPVTTPKPWAAPTKGLPVTTPKPWAAPTRPPTQPPAPQYVPFNAAENTLAERIPTWLEWSRWIAEFWNALANTPAYWLQNSATNVADTVSNTLPLVQNAPPVPLVQNTGGNALVPNPAAAAAVSLVQDSPGSNFCDGKADGLHVDPNNCQVYIQCVMGTEYRTSCPQGTAFDDTYGVCDYTANVKRCKQQAVIV